MKKNQVTVVFDRKYIVKGDGVGTVDVYLSITERKDIAVGRCKRSEFEQFKLKYERGTDDSVRQTAAKEASHYRDCKR